MQTAKISKAIIKFWSKFHFPILWYIFTWDNKHNLFLLATSLFSHRKILPPAPLDTSTAALVCIFSPILNSVMKGWKYSSFWKLFLSTKKKARKKAFLKLTWNFFQTFAWNVSTLTSGSAKLKTNILSITTPVLQNSLQGYTLSYFYGLLGGLYSLRNVSWIFYQTCILHHGSGKVSNAWCEDYWKMHLSVKKLNHFYLCP